MTKKIIYLVAYKKRDQRKICASYTTLDQAVRYCNIHFMERRNYQSRNPSQKIDSMVIMPVENDTWFSIRALPIRAEISWAFPEMCRNRWIGDDAEIFNHRLELLERKAAYGEGEED